MTKDEIRQLPELLRACQAREILNVRTWTFHKLIDAGTVKPVHIEGLSFPRFHKSAILKVAQIDLNEW